MKLKQDLLIGTKGVLFCSAKGHSGYAEAGKRLLYQMLEEGIPTTWYQFTPDNTINDDSDLIYTTVKKTINQNIPFDTAIFTCTPELWVEYIDKYRIKLIGKKLIGYVTWETSTIPDSWGISTKLLHELWVPSQFNKTVFEKYGVTIPIKVVPYPSTIQPLPPINSTALSKLLSHSTLYGPQTEYFKYGPGWKIFFTIGEWTDRKNLEGTVRTFCNAFTIEDDVKLIIKTFYGGYTEQGALYCKTQLENILKQYKTHPEILLITDELPQSDISFLHSIGTCYFSMTRGEGFCMGAFDATQYNNKVVITGYGGQIEYLGADHGGLVDYELVNVDFKERSELYTPEQEWADPCISDGIQKLQAVYNSYLPVKQTSPISLDRGWFILEEDDGFIINASSEVGIQLQNLLYDHIRFNLCYKNGEAKKTLEVTVDGNIKKKFILYKNEQCNITLPIRGVRTLTLKTEGGVPAAGNRYNYDCRNIGFTLNEIELLIVGGTPTKYSLAELTLCNEITDFYSIAGNQIEPEKPLDAALQELIKSGDIDVSAANAVRLNVHNNSEFSGIAYIGQYGTCGYATAAKGNLCYFFKKGIPVSWIPLYFEKMELSSECFYNAMVKSLIGKKIDTIDTVIIHATPDIWPSLREQNKLIIVGKKIIGYIDWETSKLPPLWVDNINNCVDELWCPSKYNKTVFKNSGVTIPIKMFPHIFLPKELPSKDSVVLKYYNARPDVDESSYYTFYNISELNPRKGVEDLVRAFCNAFTCNDKVRLILKVHYRNYDITNKKHCISVLNYIISTYTTPPSIYYILDNMTEQEMLGLHSIGDCYVSLCKSEGFGLTIFDAYKYGNKVITTGYGGAVDFLGEDYPGLVTYKMGNVTSDMFDFSKWYTEDQEWAYPNLDHATELLLTAVNN